MSIQQKINMPVALHNKSVQRLNPKHFTTTNFFRFDVAFFRELVPGQKVDISHEIFSRLEPLALPTVTNVKIRNEVFWIPMRTIYPAWNDFINDSPHSFLESDGNSVYDVPSSVPYITNQLIFDTFKSHTFSEPVEYTPGLKYDFDYDGRYWVLTGQGRLLYKLFLSLGYKPVFIDGIQHEMSAMPILAALKVYYDWYYPSQYSTDEWCQKIASILSYNGTDTNYNDLLSHEIEGVNMSLLFILFALLRLTYDQDPFTSAWDTPTGPNAGEVQGTIQHLLDPNMLHNYTDYNYVTNEQTGEYYEGTPKLDAASGSITQWGIDMLKAFTDYCKRNQISGTRAMDRYYARYGFKLDSEMMNRSVLIHSYDQIIKIGDITSTASTDFASLGSYAGRGISYDTNKFTFNTDKEFGYLMIISTIVPEIDYYQGINRHILHLGKSDFFIPEYENGAVQAISEAEVYVPADDPYANETFKNVFGFQPKYAEYKYCTSLMTGDYYVRSRNTGKDSWTTFRDLSHLYDSNGYLAHNLEFVQTNDSSQYQRIFMDTQWLNDQFNIFHSFDIVSHFPGKALFNTYEFKDEDESQKVDMQINGTTLN